MEKYRKLHQLPMKGFDSDISGMNMRYPFISSSQITQNIRDDSPAHIRAKTVNTKATNRFSVLSTDNNNITNVNNNEIAISPKLPQIVVPCVPDSVSNYGSRCRACGRYEKQKQCNHIK
uniref:Uncharacterized protein n=1 Tax=Glossina brevipalpis TaxID=37001 RepID=A0A1A9WQ92_9MUSC